MIRRNSGRQMSTIHSWRLRALFVVSIFIAGASCGEAGRDSAQVPDGSSTDTAPELGATKPLPADSWSPYLSSGPCQSAVRLMVDLEKLRLDHPVDDTAIRLLEEKVAAAQAQCTAGTGNNRPSGNWRVHNGSRVCDGYIVRRIDQDYCTDQLPEDWVPRTFNGKEYYVQPLMVPGPALAESP